MIRGSLAEDRYGTRSASTMLWTKVSRPICLIHRFSMTHKLSFIHSIDNSFFMQPSFCGWLRVFCIKVADCSHLHAEWLCSSMVQFILLIKEGFPQLREEREIGTRVKGHSKFKLQCKHHLWLFYLKSISNLKVFSICKTFHRLILLNLAIIFPTFPIRQTVQQARGWKKSGFALLCCRDLFAHSKDAICLLVQGNLWSICSHF